MQTKCLVKGCENRKGQGRFIGDLCAPCHEMLTTGKIKFGNTFIHALDKRVKFFDLLNKISDIKSEYLVAYNLNIDTIYVGTQEYQELCTYFNGEVTRLDGLKVVKVSKPSYLAGGIS